MTIAIDGPAGSGKSTIARTIAKNLGYYFLNTGSFYRAYTLAQLERGLDPMDKESVFRTAGEVKITVEDGNICLDGKNVEDKLHTYEVDKFCSHVSVDPRIREMVNEAAREISKGLNVVTEGRDTTTVVFPDADFKFYFDASPEIRARRRVSEQKEADYQQVLEAIIARDKNDREKPFGALKIAENAIYVDTTNLTIEQVCDTVYSAMQKH